MGMLKTIFGADTSKLDKGLDRAQNRVAKFSKGVSRQLGAAFSVAAIGFFFRKMTQDLDRIGKLAARGFSTDFVQDLGQAAELAGSDIEALLPKIVMLFREVNKGGTPSKEFTDNLEAIGLSINDLRGLSPEELFKRLVTGMQNTTDKATASAAAMVLLRDRGGELNTVLQSLAEGGLKESARASAESIKTAENFNDAMTVLGRQLTAVAAPALVGITKIFGYLRYVVQIAGATVGAFYAKIIDDGAAAYGILKDFATLDLEGLKQGFKKGKQNQDIFFDTIKAGAENAKKQLNELMEAMEKKPKVSPIVQDIISEEEGKNGTNTAGKTSKSVIADSMQRIGGGGRSVVATQRDESIKIANNQLSELKGIRSAIEQLEQEKMR